MGEVKLGRILRAGLENKASINGFINKQKLKNKKSEMEKPSEYLCRLEETLNLSINLDKP